MFISAFGQPAKRTKMDVAKVSFYKNKYVNIERGFEERVGIYKLYYALLNVHLWSRSYIKETKELINFYNK